MHSQFLAVDSSTDLGAQARMLKRSWAAAMGGETVAAIRPVIDESWRRLSSAGIDPERLHPRQALRPAEIEEARASSPLGGVIDVLRSCLLRFADDAEHLMVVADGQGRVLWIEGHPSVRRRAEGITFVEGMFWTEDSAGTNAIGTALAIDHAVQIFSAEHFLPEQHQWWCSAAPIHDPSDGTLIGIVDLSGPARTANPVSLALVAAAARLAEEALLVRQVAREASRAGARVAPGLRPARPAIAASSTPPSVSLLGPGPYVVRPADGGTVTLSPRHAEILALLALHPDGLSTRELTRELYGAEGNPISTRAEMSRVRRLAGELVAARPYRLSGRFLADFLEVERLLSDGETEAALAAYAGPLLPLSRLPRIERARAELEAALRRAIRGDLALLWRWLQLPAGRYDADALEMFIRAAPASDPRRAVAAARLRSLQVHGAGCG